MGRVVAIGGMAHIRIADRLHDERRVAVKLFQPGPGQGLRFRDYMEHEASALAVAANPLVVELLEFGMCVGQPFLVLEWLDGLSLREMIAAEAPLSVRRVSSIFGQRYPRLHRARDRRRWRARADRRRLRRRGAPVRALDRHASVPVLDPG